jgi:hypothetical protein
MSTTTLTSVNGLLAPFAATHADEHGTGDQHEYLVV